MAMAKVFVQVENNDAITLPISVPNLNEVRAFAHKVHLQNQTWYGEAFGWQAEYHPEKSKAPLDSNMTFTPADFCIGESGFWFFSMMWESGRDTEPLEYLDDRTL